jgi:hypothetical protein
VAWSFNNLRNTKMAISFNRAKDIKKTLMKQNVHKSELYSYHRLISSQMSKIILKEFRDSQNYLPVGHKHPQPNMVLPTLQLSDFPRI